jgi:hypothetical protein
MQTAGYLVTDMLHGMRTEVEGQCDMNQKVAPWVDRVLETHLSQLIGRVELGKRRRPSSVFSRMWGHCNDFCNPLITCESAAFYFHSVRKDGLGKDRYPPIRVGQWADDGRPLRLAKTGIRLGVPFRFPFSE